MQASQTSVWSEHSQNEDSVGNISPTIADTYLRDLQQCDYPEIEIAWTLVVIVTHT